MPKHCYRHQNTSLKIISAVGRPLPIDVEPAGFSAEYYHEMEQSLREQGQKIVEQTETAVLSLYPGDLLDFLTAEVITGSSQRVIVETALESGADLIVIGSHGYGFWWRALLGSVSNFGGEYELRALPMLLFRYDRC